MSRFQHSALSTQHSALSTQHSALSTFNKFFRRFFSALLIIALPSALAAPIYYNPWDRVQVTSAEQACLGTINYFKNNPPNTYIDWGFVRSEFGQDFDSSVVGANGDYFSGTCIMTHTNPQVGTGIFYMPFSVECFTGHIVVKKDSNSATCTSDGLSLTLTPAPNQKDPHPDPRSASSKDKIPASSTYELIAKVMEGSTPKAGVAVTFKVDVIEKTGGHGHHDASRPKGFVNGALTASGVTQGNGEIKLTFQASIVAGSHNITATCDSCSNKTAVKKVDVLVPDLQPISANPPRNPDGTYLYALTSDDPTHVGTSGGRQRGEYYLTQTANDNLRGLLDQFAEEGWGVVGLNDASLNWGGVYDIQNNWSNPHMGHRLGEEIDISFVRAGNFIGKGKQNVFYDRFCQDKKGSVPFTILHHYQLRPHFHVYLTGKKQCGKTAI